MQDFDKKTKQANQEILEEYQKFEKHGRGPCTTCNQPYNPISKLPAEKLSVLLANIEALNLLGDPKERQKIGFPVYAPYFSDNEYEIAKEGMLSMAEKYQFTIHDFEMLRRAILIDTYHNFTRELPDREILANALSKVKWQ